MTTSADPDNAVISYSNVAAISAGIALVAAGAVYSNYRAIVNNLSSLLVDKSTEMTNNIDWNNMTVPAVEQGYSQARVSCQLGSRQLAAIGKCEHDDRQFQTFYEGFMIGKDIAKTIGDGRCLGYRQNRESPYEWLSYDETEQGANEIGSGLIHIGDKFGQKTFIGIYAVNSVEWMMTAVACHFQSMIYVPLYDTLGEAAIIHIINQTRLSTIFIDKPDNVLNLLKLKSKIESLKRLVITRTMPADKESEIRKRATEANLELLMFNDLRNSGRDHPSPHHPPKPDDVFEICYTSGTTGLPKGAMLTNKNIVGLVEAAAEFFRPIFTQQETVISYLPLAHSYEQSIELFCLCYGHKIGYYLGDVRQLADDLQALKPTLMPCVPRLLNRMYDNIQTTIGHLGVLKRSLFRCAYSSKTAEVQNHRVNRHLLWDKVVFKQIQQRLGGNMKLIVSGAAPLSPKILEFLKIVCGAYVVEGYGQTECCGISSCQVPGDSSVGNIGVPLLCNMIKLCDVPDMEYYAKDNIGELCIKGSNVFAGYYNDEEKTREVIDNDGWLHTGDIATWIKTGQIQIVDRKKHMFKLAQGEYLAPERLENVYVQSKYVAQVYVHGNSYKSFTVAIVVPDSEVLLKYARSENMPTDLVELCKRKDIKELIFNDMRNLEKINELKGFEKVKDIYLHPELFSIENNLLTPTLKSKRPELAKYFDNQIEEMYKTID
ncbi:unnamed protein product [Didymodactylos carnosus]|uniref:Long-chain-fatty-acid--CoA ligase n=1 Tax=Didymodactylos carnosus TaxID=1234261 RepID=A0A813TAU5_9BILA|nr:unnamed protein product [Didymodactylos carnosus]CAF0815035.1 unnamed protein product [Didymodactylos carnosus]CAF3595587.1 unnamed protein product [Didymodactylos carnosus]CAF3599034.1 unnamed protein product [Didymodactylos carnosus]